MLLDDFMLRFDKFAQHGKINVYTEIQILFV